MTKNKETQDELKEALADLGSDRDLAETQATLDQLEANAADTWADKGSESVEEAFLALIQSNKSDEADSGLGSEMPPQAKLSDAPFAQPPVQENLTDSLNSNPFSQNYGSQDSVPPPSVFDSEPQQNFEPHQNMTSEPSFNEFTQEEPRVSSDIDERSLTEALSETIAQSLAEIQTGDPIEEEMAAPVQNDPIMQSVAMHSEPQVQAVPQQPQMPPQQAVSPFQHVQQQQAAQVPPQAPVRQQAQTQPPVLPEFPNTKADPLNQYAMDVQGQAPKQTAPVDDLIADMAGLTASEIRVDSNSNNNDVMNQHHAYSNPFEIQKPQPAQVPPQAPVTQFGGTTGESSQVAKMSAPVPVELTGPGGNNKSNADPEFQALVQWSNSDVEPSHHGPHDMPNFLSQKREDESRFSIKTVFLSIGISVIVIGMFYVGYQAGSGGQDQAANVYDGTATPEGTDRTAAKTDEADRMFVGNTASTRNRQAVASTPVKPEATITLFEVASLKGRAGRSIPMNIQLEGDNLGQETMLLLRGIPNEITLSKGIKREGVWSVPISDLRKLALNVPASYRGNFDFEVFAFKDKESGPEHRLASVRIDALPKPAIRKQEIVRPDQPVRPPVQDTPAVIRKQESTPPPVVDRKPPPQPTINASVEAAMLKRANALLKNGDVAGARLVFEHVAVMGSKHAAFALAKTYDKQYLLQLDLDGIVDDVNLARKWYKKAADMGHAAAASRLQQLSLR